MLPAAIKERTNMNLIYHASTLLLICFITTLDGQDSSLRPRVQLAYVTNDLDGLLSCLDAVTVSQGHQAIKQLRTQIETLERKNQQLTTELATALTEQKDLKECSKKLSQAQTTIGKLKKQV